jgi:hypothetical protein
METCLFTGEALADDTHEEHCIPRSLAGKIVSSRVSSSSFNNRASEIDHFLGRSYTQIMHALSPLLASGDRQAPVTGVTEGGMHLRVGADGIAEAVSRAEVLQRGENRRPTAIRLRDSSDAGWAADHFGLDPDLVRNESITAYEEYIRLPEFPIVCIEAEIAALKSIMLSFDALLVDCPDCRFTRHAGVGGARELVRAFVMDGDKLWPAYDDHVLGYQYGRLQDLLALRRKYGSPAKTQFEHVLLASGNVANRTLDVAWLVAGFDPVGFRLSRTWDAYDFTCVAVAGMLRGQRACQPIWRPWPHYICQRTPYRAWSTGDRADVERALRELFTYRDAAHHAAYRDAVLLREMKCDEYVTGLLDTHFAAAGKRGEGDVSPADVLAVGLRRLYGRRLESDGAQRDFTECIMRVLGRPHQGFPQLLEKGASRSGGWREYLPLYREALREAVRDFGQPGDFESSFRLKSVPA